MAKAVKKLYIRIGTEMIRIKSCGLINQSFNCSEPSRKYMCAERMVKGSFMIVFVLQ